MSDNQTPRQYLIEQLSPLIPKGWVLVPFNTILDSIGKPTVVLNLQTIRRSPEAPQGALTAEYLITVLEPKQDPGAAAEALDDKLLDLMYALRTIPGLLVKEANYGVYTNTNYGYDIRVEVLTTAPTTPTL